MSPIISEVEMKGKHYDALIMDDMPIGMSVTAHKDVDKEVKQVTDWWKMVTLGDKKMHLDMAKKMFGECTSGEDTPKLTREKLANAWAKLEALRPTPIFKNITEGGNEMHKELYHVILFNRKTEKIDYKAYITAVGEIEAGMTAAHNYDKYDGKIHKHIVKLIEGSEYEVIK